MKTTIHIFVTAKKETDWSLAAGEGEKVVFEAFPFDMSEHDCGGRILVCEADVEIDVPETLDFIAAEVANLKRERDRVRAELGKRLMEIDDSIAKLTCIGNEPTEAA